MTEGERGEVTVEEVVEVAEEIVVEMMVQVKRRVEKRRKKKKSQRLRWEENSVEAAAAVVGVRVCLWREG